MATRTRVFWGKILPSGEQVYLEYERNILLGFYRYADRSIEMSIKERMID